MNESSEVKEAKIKNLIQDIIELKNRRDKAFAAVIVPLNQRIEELTAEKVKLLCPFQKGDIVVNKRGNRAIITNIVPQDYGRGYNLFGYKLKKDGTPSKFHEYFWDYGGNFDWKLDPVRKKEGGASLIEVLVVIGVLAILAAVVTLGIQQLIAKGGL